MLSGSNCETYTEYVSNKYIHTLTVYNLNNLFVNDAVVWVGPWNMQQYYFQPSYLKAMF